MTEAPVRPSTTNPQPRGAAPKTVALPKRRSDGDGNAGVIVVCRRWCQRTPIATSWDTRNNARAGRTTCHNCIEDDCCARPCPGPCAVPACPTDVTVSGEAPTEGEAEESWKINVSLVDRAGSYRSTGYRDPEDDQSSGDHAEPDHRRSKASRRRRWRERWR